ncbi:ANTAR domain-containing response regulator [Sulfitobacter guttiformis]|uniref:AmiR/NasT family two-component response regulator n=1 Tax=Sulfitobacter guttiformis TaxID=74349 RepID=A0A420DI13_9RHOB|nr:ANTAR domain-containing protein [Sulfitobacter guttiformis]KIN72384.1 Transcription antitermination protein [Sulfitobacter guttiformis KCTC 32187]RKE93860.1 AmiR/NasT family two-component response regulator [Sulfitobacter guttiformis]
MRTQIDIAGLEGARAVVMHPEHDRLNVMLRQLRAIGLEVEVAWPTLPASAITADFTLYDTDAGHDAQFPWQAGNAPMPMIALVGSEAPGRIEWASRIGADALLVKPLAASGVFAALLMARQSFERRKALLAEIDALHGRLSARQTIVQAVSLLAKKTGSEETAYDDLRKLAMAWQMTMEDAAVQIVKHKKEAGRYRDCS